MSQALKNGKGPAHEGKEKGKKGFVLRNKEGRRPAHNEKRISSGP